MIQAERLFEFVFPGNIMISAILAMSFISILPNALLYFVSKNIKPATLSLLFNFAGGSLLGDVSFYLLPHILMPHKDGTERTDLQKTVIAIFLCLGVCLFYGTDTYIKFRSREPNQIQSKSQNTTVTKRRYNLRPRKGDSKEIQVAKSKETIDQKCPSTNVVVDIIRNVTNGMALVASFYISSMAGVITTIALFSHRTSIEISDAIKDGSTKACALRAQFVKTVCTCIGTFVGIALYEVVRRSEESGLFETSAGWSDAIISFIIGKFVYLITVGIMVEMPSTESKERSQSIKEILSMAFGLHLMMFISWNEGRQKYE